MSLLSWFKRKKTERDAVQAKKEAQIQRIYKQVFDKADESERITKEVNDKLQGQEVDIAEQIFLATRRKHRR